jgi:hypothetical protein
VIRLRAGLTTRISARFLGGYMLQSVSNRAAFEDSVQAFLADELAGVDGNHRVARQSRLSVVLRSGDRRRVRF